MAIQTPKQTKIIYSDFLASFDANPNTNDLVVVTNEQAIINSIKKILKTDYYEIPYNPHFGSNIRKLLFENYSTIIEKELKNEITLAINNFEPRANVIDIQIEGYPDQNSIAISITFSIINSQTPITIIELLTKVR